QEAKIGWLAIQYGVGAWKLAKMFGWPFKSVADLEREFGKPAHAWGDPEWRVYKAQRGVRTKDEFFEMCPGIREMMDSLMERADTRGSIRLWTGRAIHFD